MNIIYLGSKSQSRKMLLDDAKIPYKIVPQDVDETKCDWGLSLQKVVESIALYKMEHLILPNGKNGEIIFVLTADTLSQDSQGIVQGKPENEEDTIVKIKAAAQGVNQCATAFCLDRKINRNGSWHLDERILKCVDASYEFIIPDHWIKEYLKNCPDILNAAGAIRIEGYGAQFMRMIKGSYSTIVGLPMFELREALEQLRFY